jgi:hypothetical protein
MEYSTNSPVRDKLDGPSFSTQRRSSNVYNVGNIIASEDNINS